MVHIAVYGKGGIGKSTISSNISYSLSVKGVEVTQMGCDPKHDSTVSLLDGKEQPTVLDYLRETPESERHLEDIVVTGVNGIRCIEAGGPRPGIGCAGRGILTTFDTLAEMGLTEPEGSVTVYDVLGDVVCGGFAVPMRKENADAVFVVTSGEFMSMYAANNILRGLMNFDPLTPRAAGIILNRRGMDGEYERVKALSDSVGVPIVADIPRAPEFKQATYRKKTVSEAFPDSDPAKVFSGLADMVLDIAEGKVALHCPHPLSDGQIDDFGRGRNVGLGNYVPNRKCCSNYTTSNGMCASIGAANEAGRIPDLPVIVHGPMSCGHIMSQAIERHYVGDLVGNPEQSGHSVQPIISTDMEDSSSIFGGNRKLLDTLEDLKKRDYRHALVITTCVTGMIGDDVDSLVDGFVAENPDFNVLMVHADGNHTGTADEGRDQTLEAFFSLIDTSQEPTVPALNLVDRSFMRFARGNNKMWFGRLLDSVGIRQGIRIFEECTLEEVRLCKRNKLNMMLSDDPGNRVLKSRLESMGFRFMSQTVPCGHSQTVKWIEEVSEITGNDCGDAIREIETSYADAVARYRPFIEGKVFDIALSYSRDIDWILETIMDCGGILRNTYLFPSRFIQPLNSRFVKPSEVRADMTYQEIVGSLNSDPADIVIMDRRSFPGIDCRIATVSGEFVGHLAAINYMEYLKNMMVTNEIPGWKNWRCL